MIIETRGLLKEYGRTAAVRDLNLAIPEGGITGFLGPNGSGKTTTIKVLLGQIRPTAGEAFVFGMPAGDDASSVEIRRRVGYVSEDKRLYAYMTVEQMLDFTRPLYRRWSCEREESLMKRFELPRRRKCKALSKGMRAKLALVLALARRPQLLILDEPGEGLDPVAIEQMLEAVVEAAADGATVFFSTHQLAEVERIADHVCVLKAGGVVLQGALEEYRENYRRVHAAFPCRPPLAEMSVEGVWKMSSDGHVMSLVANGNVDEIIRRVRALGAISVEAHPMSLRELFLESVAEERS